MTSKALHFSLIFSLLISFGFSAFHSVQHIELEHDDHQHFPSFSSVYGQHDYYASDPHQSNHAPDQQHSDLSHIQAACEICVVFSYFSATLESQLTTHLLRQTQTVETQLLVYLSNQDSKTYSARAPPSIS